MYLYHLSFLTISQIVQKHNTIKPHLVDILYLVGCPHSSSLRHPLSRVDSCVDPDSRTVGATSAELKTK